MSELMWVEIIYTRPSGGQGSVRSTMSGSTMTEDMLKQAGCVIVETKEVALV